MDRGDGKDGWVETRKGILMNTYTRHSISGVGHGDRARAMWDIGTLINSHTLLADIGCG